MEISEIKIFKANKRGAVLAYANIILDESFIIRGITLLENEKSGRFISMPSRIIRSGNRNVYRDICHPLNSNVREELTHAIFEAYDDFMDNEK